MCSHSAPFLIIRSHSAVSCPKSEARTEGAMTARGIVTRLCSRSNGPYSSLRKLIFTDIDI